MGAQLKKGWRVVFKQQEEWTSLSITQSVLLKRGGKLNIQSLR